MSYVGLQGWANSAAAELARRELARRKLGEFAVYTNPKYQIKWFHAQIAAALEKVERGEIKRLMVFMPPQHGKSQLTTRAFSAWAIGRNPEARVAVASYSATMARRFSRDVRRVIESDEYRAVFPKFGLPTKKDGQANTVDLIETTSGRGSLYFVGRGGSLTGMSVDLGIIDDPLKDRAEAMSSVVLEGLWSWYTDVFESRILDAGRQVLIQTRWAQDDLAGRLLERDGYWSENNLSGWTVISFEALRTNIPNSADPRAVGEALWPERKNADALVRIREKNKVTFNSLYQQDPKPDEELLVFGDWKPIDKFPENCETVVYGLDFGFTNHPTAIVKVGFDGENQYVEEVIYERGLTNAAIVARIKAAGLQEELFICESAEPKSVTELQSLGINAMHAVKGPGSKNLGIDRMKQYNVYYVKTGKNLTYEVKNYQWLVVAGKITNTPQKGNDHALDAVRYVNQTLIM